MWECGGKLSDSDIMFFWHRQRGHTVNNRRKKALFKHKRNILSLRLIFVNTILRMVNYFWRCKLGVQHDSWTFCRPGYFFVRHESNV